MVWTYALVVVVVALAGVTLSMGVALVRSRRRHRAAVEERGRMLERESDRAARAAVDAERARIARELHDIVSHNVSLMVVQAGAAREVMPIDPDACAQALEAVENAGRSAMSELRHLLGLLAPAPDGADDSVLAPSPGLDGLNTLIDRFAFTGLHVETRVLGEPRPLPPGIDATVYRIIQEALTNALKHAEPDTKAEVTIRYADNQVRVEVLNTGPSALTADPGRAAPTAQRRGRDAGAGRGLLGLSERVAVYGGDLDARRRLGGGYRIRARIPLKPPRQDGS
ncbi:Histidine kinase-, DNA gyrase B-, and HSP90-like ATPase [Nonomuraea maritima]|uniref:histidine kinase n=1 Tax=Nonomuraea maritima TaxID=683260 RepID=A0A1G8Z9S4_9ACTN|nr:histidine kinase [Nonomuraea maritima]SDK11743.1 Histidine kinase-, DNA gyrase B-, and HSP90-like ATPase [Nonomuraea maritima]